MTNEQLKYGVVGLLIGGVIVWLMTSSTSNFTFRGMMNQQYNSRNMMQSSDAIDAHFIEQMIPHHEDAIIMAKLALTKATHPEITQLAQDIIDSQSKEIEQMKTWYQQWYDRELPTGDQIMQHHGMASGSGMHMGMMGNESDMTRLEQAVDFDKVFIEQMIPHHQMAVMMASMLKNGTERPEMTTLADDIVTAQTKEIEQMRQWYDAWY